MILIVHQRERASERTSRRLSIGDLSAFQGSSPLSLPFVSPFVGKRPLTKNQTYSRRKKGIRSMLGLISRSLSGDFRATWSMNGKCRQKRLEDRRNRSSRK